MSIFYRATKTFLFSSRSRKMFQILEALCAALCPLPACCPSTNTKTSSLTKQWLCDAHAKEIELVLKERMPSGLPGEGIDKVEGNDKVTIERIVSPLLWRRLYLSL